MLDEFKNAFQRPNNGLIQLIIINVVVYVALSVLKVFALWFNFESVFVAVYDQFSLPSSFLDFLHRPWTLITYFFSHSMIQFLHILFNMLVLYWFGRIFTEYLGSDKLIAVYVLGGIAGGLVYLMAYNLIPNPPEFLSRGTGLVGASAAIFAVMVAIATMLPDYTVFLMFLGPVKIKYIAGVYIFLSFVGSVGSNAGGEIAHLGGALIGFVYTKQLQAGVNWGAWVTYLLEGIKSLFRPRPKVKVSYRKSDGGQRPTAGAGISQKEIDEILDKISDGGYESLSKDEKEKLFKASKK